MSRDELKNRIDKATRKKIDLKPVVIKTQTYEEREEYLARQRRLAQLRLQDNGLVPVEGTKDIVCTECGKRGSKFAALKYRHESTCKHYKDW